MSKYCKEKGTKKRVSYLPTLFFSGCNLNHTWPYYLSSQGLPRGFEMPAKLSIELIKFAIKMKVYHMTLLLFNGNVLSEVML